MIAGRGRGKIRAPRRGLYGSNDAVDFDESWNILHSSLLEIHNKNASQLSFEELYRHAYKLVLKKQGDLLYQKVKDVEEAWLSQKVQPRILSSTSLAVLLPSDEGGSTAVSENEKRAEGEKLLRSLKEAWNDHELCMNMITDVLMYMERVYCKDVHKPSIFVASMGQFRDFVLRAPLPDIKGKATEATIAKILNTVILSQIKMDRNGDIIDKALLKSCITMLEGLYETDEEDESRKLYLTSFEQDFLTASRAFYREEGASLLQDSDAGTFCRHARRRLDEEQDRCRSSLSSLTGPKIRSVVEDELIRNHLRDAIALEKSGVRYMLDNDRLIDLEMIYDLSNRVDEEKKELKQAVQARIVESGAEINKVAMNVLRPDVPKETVPTGEEGKAAEKPVNQQTAAAIQWVDDVLRLKARYDHVLDNAFQSDPILQTAMTRSFSDFINEFHRGAEYLSLFFDENMKKGIKGKTENEVDALIDQGITLLGYISDKDLFERYYKKHLSKRLLTKKSVSMDAERQMISKMKLAVGNAFTTRIEKMLQDMNTSADLTASYREHVASLGDPDPKRADIDVSILTSTMWPIESVRNNEPSSRCIFPTEIERVRRGFQNFYLDKHSGRQLTWQANMGSADVRACFPDCKGAKKTRELSVTTYGMIILMLFNDLGDKPITCEEIEGSTNIPHDDLVRNLQSLSVAPKTRILKKDPMSKDVKPGDKFTFNSSFYSPFQKIKVLLVTSGNQVEGTQERTETERKNDHERQGVIDAALVRIMKQRKESTHQKLMAEVIAQLNTRFSPDIAMVKKRIESLIEREYLERLEKEPPAYRYLA